MKVQARPVLFVLFVSLIFIFLACKRSRQPELSEFDTIDRRSNLPMVEPVQRDLANIKERGTLTVLAPYNSTTYFLYRGEPLGYEFELLRSFAEAQGVALKVIVVTDPKSFFPLLNSGDGDIVAARLVPTEQDKQHVSFTNALYRTEPALVQQEKPAT